MLNDLYTVLFPVTLTFDL